MQNRKPTGLIGVGLMGEVLARRLIDAGFDVIGFDINPKRNARLAEIGGRPATSIGDVARQCTAIVLAVFDTDQVEQVIEHGLIPEFGDEPGKIVICTSTCDPDRMAALEARITNSGVRFLEAPISGTNDQVRRGQGVGLIGGDPSVVAEVSSVIGALFPTRFHVGAVGDGGRMKLAVNLILGLNRLALAEGLVFATRLGLEPSTFLKVARQSAAYSQVMDTKGPKMLRGDFSPEGRTRQTLKDVHLMLAQAQRKGQKLPALEIHGAVLEACLAHGEGELDNSVVIEEIRRQGPAAQRS